MATELTASSPSKLLVSLPSPESLIADRSDERKLDLESGSSKSSENLLVNGVESRRLSVSGELRASEHSGIRRYSIKSVLGGVEGRGILI